MSAPRRWPSVLLPGVAAVAAAWSLIPFAIWWSGVDRRYFLATWQAWGWGSLVAAGAALLLLVLTKGRAATRLLAAWRAAAGSAGETRFVTVVGVVLGVLAVLMCLFVFSGNPRNVDGFAQLFQARIFLSGRLWAPPPPEVANFATLHMIVGPDRWFSQYPPGQSVVLAVGLFLGAWWLLNPLFAGLLVFASHRVAKWCAGDSTARLTAVLLCLSPFVVAVAGSEMSHLPAAALGMLAAAAATGIGGSRPRGSALLAGAALGCMAGFRPLDAVAAAVPVAFIAASWGPRKALAGLVAIAGAAALATLPTLWYNSRTTGSWLEFGYTYLWGPQHALGFHPVPWGVPLTASRAVALTGLDLHQLNTYLMDIPFPILPVAAAGWVLGRRHITAKDAAPFLGAGALVSLLFFYWHRDVFYGPRLLFSAVPWVIMIVARALMLLRGAGRVEWYPGVTGGLALVLACTVGLALGLVWLTPGRLGAYRAAWPVFSLHPDRDAERAGVGRAVVVIPDGWGSRLIVRMWAEGVPPRRSGRLYAAIDACALELALDAAERDPARRARLLVTLDSLAALGRPGVPGGAAEGLSLLLPRDSALAPPCRSEVASDRTGLLAFSPFLYLNTPTLDGDIVWARDLRVRNAALFARYAGRRFYRYAPPAPGERPTFTPLTPQGN